MTPPRPAIVAAIVVRDGRVLLVRRRIAEGSLSWQFPAGEREHGETVEHAAVRETAEEVGLPVRSVSVIGERDHPVTGRYMIYIECEADNDDATILDTEELAELAWCDQATLSEKVPSGLFEPVAAYLREHLG